MVASADEAKKESLYKKTVWLGNRGTGKSSFLTRCTQNTFSMDYKDTVGVNFARQCMRLENKELTLQHWDIGGAALLGSLDNLTRVYYNDANGATISWDVTDRGTFDGVMSWYTDLLKKLDQNGVSEDQIKKLPVAFMANKLDLISGVYESKEFNLANWNIIQKNEFEEQAKSLLKKVNGVRTSVFGAGNDLEEIQIYLSSAKWDIAYRVTVTENTIKYSDCMTIADMMADFGKVVALNNPPPQSTAIESEPKIPRESVKGYQRYNLTSNQKAQLDAHQKELKKRWKISNAARYLGSFFKGWNTGAKEVEIDHLLKDQPAKISVVENGILKDIVIDNKIIYQSR